MNKAKKCYVAYEGDKFLCVGMVDELAQYFGVKKEYIWKRIWEQNKKCLDKEARKIKFYEVEEDDND